jgi:hypothetical protein
MNVDEDVGVGDGVSVRSVRVVGMVDANPTSMDMLPVSSSSTSTSSSKGVGEGVNDPKSMDMLPS